MASFQDHIKQSIHNYTILEQVNKIPNSIDWQITISFYTALHLIDAYLAKEGGLHYNKHTEVRNAIWFDGNSKYKLDEIICLHYRSLENLSRKSRYLCSDNSALREQQKDISHPVKDKDLKRAFDKISAIIDYFQNRYPKEIDFKPIKIFCKEAQIGSKIPFVNF